MTITSGAPPKSPGRASSESPGPASSESPGPAPSESAVDHVMEPVDWLRLVLPGVIWGSSFYLIAEGLDSFHPALIAPLRVLFGFATLLALPAARAPIERSDRWRVAVLGVVWLAMPLTLFPFAEERVSSSVTGMLNGATPLFVATVATMIARRPPPGRQLVGLLVGFAGVVVIALPSLDKGSSSALGVAMIFAALACYGVALNVVRPLLLRYGPLPVLCRAQAVALVLTAPFGIAVLPRSSFSWHSALAVVALGALGTGAAYVLAAENVGRLGSTRASVSTYLIPVVALSLGVVLRDEGVALLAIVGSLVALLGAYLTNRSPRRGAERRHGAGTAIGHAVPMTIFEHPINTLDGEPSTLADYQGRPVLLVNVASRCGLTPQYTGLEHLQREYGGRGFSVLGFPCNQFGGQEPGNAEEIQTFCSTSYGVTFPMFEKIEVNGPGRHPIYAELSDVVDAEGHSGDIRWNFEKFLVGPDGSVARFGPRVAPDDPELVGAIEAIVPEQIVPE